MPQPASNESRTIGPYRLAFRILRSEEISVEGRFREDFNDGGELEASILEHGILQSIIVQECPGKPYRLLGGGRRHRIATKHKLDIPALVSTVELDELTVRTIELVENFHRRALSPYEDCKLKQEIHRLQQARHGIARGGGDGKSKSGWSMEDTAKMLGTSKFTISNDLKLAEAMDCFPELRELKDKKAVNKVVEGLLKQYTQDESAKAYLKQMQNDEGPKKKLIDSYIIGDFFEAVKQLPERAFDFVELDPFYGIELLELYAKRCNGTTAYIKENYTDVPKEVYEWYIRETFRECYRVMSDNSWGICWFAMEPWFEPTFQALRDAGFYARRVPGFWIKPSGAAYNANLLLASAVDSFFYFRKGQPVLNCPGSINTFYCGTVPPTRKIHPTERPIELYEQIIPVFAAPGSRMFIPFVGSGNQLLAASNLKISAIGFDLCYDYKNGFIIRVQEGDFGHYRSLK